MVSPVVTVQLHLCLNPFVVEMDSDHAMALRMQSVLDETAEREALAAVAAAEAAETACLQAIVFGRMNAMVSYVRLLHPGMTGLQVRSEADMLFAREEERVRHEGGPWVCPYAALMAKARAHANSEDKDTAMVSPVVTVRHAVVTVPAAPVPESDCVVEMDRFHRKKSFNLPPPCYVWW
jgi:hypothetical protein